MSVVAFIWEARFAFECRCIYLSWEADTGPNKAHDHSWQSGKEREEALAYTMVFDQAQVDMGAQNHGWRRRGRLRRPLN